MDGNPIDDYVMIRVPSHTVLDQRTIMRLDDIAKDLVTSQYNGRQRPKMIFMHETTWVLTSDWKDIATIQPGDGCPSCVASNDQAIAYLKEFPDQKIALCNLSYSEFW